MNFVLCFERLYKEFKTKLYNVSSPATAALSWVEKCVRSDKNPSSKTAIIIVAIITIAVTVLVLPATATAQVMQDNWYRTFSTTQSDTLFLAEGDATQGSYYLAIRLNGTANKDDSVIYNRRFYPTVHFEGILKVSTRGYGCNEGCAPSFGVKLYHGDTIISSSLVASCEGPWQTAIWSGNDFSGSLAVFDSLSITAVLWGGCSSLSGGLDLDNFRVNIGGQDIIFYDGGEYGSISGTIFSDTNSNGAQDVGEEGLGGWLLFLDDGAYIDTATSQENGRFSFSQVPRGTYTITPEDRGCLQTVPPTYAVTVTISSDTLHHQLAWGMVCSDGYRVDKRWNIVSLPRVVTNPVKTALFPNAVSAAFAYIPGLGYEESDTLEVGKGYWLKFPVAQIVVIPGDTVWIDTVEVEEGWNLIGSPTFSLAATNITSQPPGLIASQFYGYNTGYYTADTLVPAKGYWVKVNQAGWLILNTLASALYSNRIQIVPTDELPPAPPEGLEIRNPQHGISNQFDLMQNYPNPFNPITEIRYQLPYESKVILKVYNVLGQEVITLINEVQSAGYKSVNWDFPNVASGVYFYRIEATSTSNFNNTFNQSRKMLLVR